MAGTVVTIFGVVLLLGIGGPLVLGSLGVSSLTVGTPGTITFVFAFVNTPTEMSLSLGAGVLGVGAVIGLLYALFRSYTRSLSGKSG